MKREIMMYLVLSSSVAFSTSPVLPEVYQEQRPPQVRNESEISAKTAACTTDAVTLAAKILNNTKAEELLVRVTSYEDFSDQAWDYEKKESFAFGRGESGLTVVMLPNYYGDGKCQFDSAQMWRD